MSNKLTKTVIKSIVKECLVEILAEGIYANNSQNSLSKKKRSINKSLNELKSERKRLLSQRAYSDNAENNNGISGKRRPNYLDSIKFNNTDNNQKRKSNINTSLTNDSTLNEMLADTAETTLREQISAEHKRGISTSSAGDRAAKIVNESDPIELFGKSASKWADLAFSKPITK